MGPRESDVPSLWFVKKTCTRIPNIATKRSMQHHHYYGCTSISCAIWNLPCVYHPSAQNWTIKFYWIGRLVSIQGEIQRTSSQMNPATHAAMTAPVEVWKTEGFLYKRQRGRRSNDLQKLKFQKRFCQLTATAFEYYKDCKTVITHRLSIPGFAFNSSRYLSC